MNGQVYGKLHCHKIIPVILSYFIYFTAVKPLLPILFILLGSTLFGQVRQSTITVRIDSTRTRPALLALPDSYSGSQGRYPLIIFLHGYDEAGQDVAKLYRSPDAGGPSWFIANRKWPASFLNPADGQRYQFIVLSPQNNSYSITATQLPQIISDVIKNYRIDSSRIYITGITAGGDAAVSYVAKLGVTPAIRPAAIVPMSAAINPPQQAWARTLVQDSVKIWAFGSDPADLYGKMTQSLVKFAQGLQPSSARFTNYDGGRCCWNRFYDPGYREEIDGKKMNIYEWMLQYKREAGTGKKTALASNNNKPKAYILKADEQGHLLVDNSNRLYQPGDTLLLSGAFKSISINNLSGSPKQYIVISNVPGQPVHIGDSTWSGGSYAHALGFGNCHYIRLGGTRKQLFNITGSNSTAADAGGFPVRAAYFNLAIGELSDNFIVQNITIRHGGTGVWAKTEVSSTNPATWFPNTFLNNFDFYNLDIYNTYNEGMYIGHTGSYWNIQNKTPLYPHPNEPAPDARVYKRPIKLRNVKIHHNRVHSSGGDGIQAAAIDNLELYNNEVFNWAANKNSAHNGGILIGGRVKGFNVYNNYVHDGWGEMLQVYAEGGGPRSTVTNNLLLRNKQDGVSLRGTHQLGITFSHNTVAYTGTNIIRINGYFGGTGTNIITKNILANPMANGGQLYPSAYIYTENGGVAQDTDNKKFVRGAEAGLNEKARAKALGF